MVCAPFMTVASHTDVLLAHHTTFAKEGMQDEALRMSAWGAIMTTGVKTCGSWSYKQWEIRGTLSYFFFTRLLLFEHRAPTQSVCVTDIILE